MSSTLPGLCPGRVVTSALIDLMMEVCEGVERRGEVRGARTLGGHEEVGLAHR